jgi:hypothetical protein
MFFLRKSPEAGLFLSLGLAPTLLRMSGKSSWIVGRRRGTIPSKRGRFQLLRRMIPQIGRTFRPNRRNVPPIGRTFRPKGRNNPQSRRMFHPNRRNIPSIGRRLVQMDGTFPPTDGTFPSTSGGFSGRLERSPCSGNGSPERGRRCPSAPEPSSASERSSPGRTKPSPASTGDRPERMAVTHLGGSAVPCGEPGSRGHLDRDDPATGAGDVFSREKPRGGAFTFLGSKRTSPAICALELAP